ncbi:hypothetical protein [Gracilibacillus salinarum]|uniref:Sulfotransferase family protein n=1 Tax=Gracilibacillus salinarum TaxID=2932255 RepID=A0ABY4GJH9_9BACI|nr:hypothetical protein [Gracilibacillus salinarum]UOQ84351.1 hypothetical protein MUN87_16890 [Gracilibacillus salinarum]
MIISHKHKFIFIKTRKTAGTSIEISLSRYCGDQDIITPISPKDEKIRKKLGKQPQHYHKLYNHMRAQQIKKFVGEEIWKDYYTFCFDRIYTINDQVCVDKVGRFEHLQEDLAEICDTIGLPFDGWLPNAKSDYRKDKRPYRAYYTAEQRVLIEKQFAKEIALFGYQF